MGRPPAKAPSPDLLVPEPFGWSFTISRQSILTQPTYEDSVTKILDRFKDAGFDSNEVVALLAS